jgi:hypothetical protein
MAFGSTPADSNNIPIGCVYVPGTGFKALQGGKLFTDASSNDSAPVRVEEVGGSKATYSYSINALAPPASVTDIMVLRGSATKLVKVVEFGCSGAATAATSVVWFLKKHTIANTSGTGTLAATATQHDSTDAAQTAVINTYQSTVPTIDGTATFLQIVRLDLAILPAASAILTDRYILDYGQSINEPVTLRGVAQEFALNLGGGAVPSVETVDFSITWTEE